MIDLLGYIVSTAATWAALLYFPFALTVWLAEKYISKHLDGFFKPKALRKILNWMSQDEHGVGIMLSIAWVFILSMCALGESTEKGNTLGFVGNFISNINHISLYLVNFWFVAFTALLFFGGVDYLLKKFIELQKEVIHNMKDMAKCRAIVIDISERQEASDKYVMTGEQLDALRAYMSAFYAMQGSDSLDLNEKFNRKREILFALRVIPKD